MTTPRDAFSEQLGRLLDEAANGFDARPDVPRLQRMLGGTGRRRGALVMFSAAACLAVLGGAAVALDGGGRDSGIAPARSAESPGPTAPRTPLVSNPTTETTPPAVTRPPKDRDPASTEPPTPQPTEKPASPPTTDKPAPSTTDKPAAPSTTEKPPAPSTTEKPPAPSTTEKPPAPSTTEKPAPPPTDPWQWSAVQMYGFCEEDPPYDVFHGTTAPGAKVRVESEFGSGYVRADEQGHWEVTVYFPTAPVNEPFQVWVSSEGHLDDFWFTRTG